MQNPSFLMLAKSVENKLAQQQWEKALNEIKLFVEKIIHNPFCHGVVVDVPGLDALCQKAGHAIINHFNKKTQDSFCHPGSFACAQDKLREWAQNDKDSSGMLYIVSQLYTSGGHTAVLEDFIKAQPGVKHTILFTDIFNMGEEKAIRERFSKYNVSLVWAKEKSLLEKFIWLRKSWQTLNPEKIYLFNHHQDVVAIAAASKELPGKLYFYHHTDFQLGLGMRLEHAVHIDIHNLAFAHCRKLNINNNVLLPLTCKDFGARELTQHSFRREGKLNTASAGAYYKYALPYPYSYVDLVPAILQATQGTHTHIGFLWFGVRRRIRKKLKAMNIDPARFKYMSVVRHFWQTLKELNIDLYITSFPIGGGRTCLEVMGSGTPIIYHDNFRSLLLSEKSLIYTDGLSWKTPDELIATLKALTPEMLLQHGKRGRKHYENNYREAFLTERLRGDLESTAVNQSIDIDLVSPRDAQLLIEISDHLLAKRSWLVITKLKHQLKKVAKKLLRIGQNC